MDVKNIFRTAPECRHFVFFGRQAFVQLHYVMQEFHLEYNVVKVTKHDVMKKFHLILLLFLLLLLLLRMLPDNPPMFRPVLSSCPW